MCNQKDQTSKEDLTKLEQCMKDNKEAKGIGVFLVPAPEQGILEYKVVIVEEEITYEECAKRGHNCAAFKWVIGKTVVDAKAEKNKEADCGMCRNRDTNYPYCTGGGSWKCMCHPNYNVCKSK